MRFLHQFTKPQVCQFILAWYPKQQKKSLISWKSDLSFPENAISYVMTRCQNKYELLLFAWVYPVWMAHAVGMQHHPKHNYATCKCTPAPNHFNMRSNKDITGMLLPGSKTGSHSSLLFVIILVFSMLPLGG